MKVRIDDIVQVMTYIDGSFYLEIEDEDHLKDVVQHLIEYWEINKQKNVD